MADEPAQARLGRQAPEVLWLLGQPQLADYLHFVEQNVVGGAAMSPRALADEWRAANDIYFELEESEAGIADEIDCQPLDSALEHLVRQLEADPHYLATFDALPVSVEMVELDRLVVSQLHVTSSFSEQRAQALGPCPSPEALFRYCQPLERDPSGVTIERSDNDRFIFSSVSTDLRPQDVHLLRSDQLPKLASIGAIAGAVAFSVGYGSNFLSAIRSDDRLVLHNGYHRAHSLRSLGITHAPCIVQSVTRRDELALAATEKVSGDPSFYFRARRPPILRDYFDQRLTRRFPVKRRRTIVEVEFTVRKSFVVEEET